MVSQDLIDRNYVRQFQSNSDQTALNQLIHIYFQDSCKYASKFLNSQLFSSSVSWNYGEVASYVFLAFLKAARNYKWDDKSSVSFKNYLYQLIKFETIHEIKRLFAWKFQPQQIEKIWNQEEVINSEDGSDFLKEFLIRDRVAVIYDFLLPKGKDYSLIWDLKSQGAKNSEICKQLNISEVKLKSRWQYIKKLILEAYPSLDKVF